MCIFSIYILGTYTSYAILCIKIKYSCKKTDQNNILLFDFYYVNKLFNILIYQRLDFNNMFKTSIFYLFM